MDIPQLLRKRRGHLWLIVILNLGIAVYTAEWFTSGLGSMFPSGSPNTLLVRIIQVVCALICIASLVALNSRLTVTGAIISAIGLLYLLINWGMIYLEDIAWAQMGSPRLAFDSLWFILVTARMILLAVAILANLWLAVLVRRSRSGTLGLVP